MSHLGECFTLANDAPGNDYLTSAEISAAFKALSVDDRLKLGAVETIRRSGTHYGKGELLHEAICRALMGHRKCPRQVSFIAFLMMTMKSLSSHARNEGGRVISLNPNDISEDVMDGEQVEIDRGLTGPEDALLQKRMAELRDEIYAYFESDDAALLVLFAWAESKRGRELRDATGLDQAAVDYAAKRIRTYVRGKYPEGWSR